MAKRSDKSDFEYFQRDISKKAKAVWLIMLSVSLSFFCVEVSYVFQEYAKHPVGSQWTRKSENYFSFPTILLCPEKWINETKAIKDFGLSELSIVYLAAYTIVENPTLQHHELFNDVAGNFSWVRDQVEDVILRHNIKEPSIPNLLLQLAYDFDEVATYTNPFMGVSLDDPLQNEKQVVTNFGVCYRRIIPKYSKEMLPTPIGDLKIDIQFSDSFVLKRPNLVKVFVGYYEGDALPAAPLTLSKGFSYQVKVKSTHSMQIVNDINHCEDKLVDSSFRRACEYHCFNEALWTPCYGCHFKAGLNISYHELCHPIQIMMGSGYNQSERVSTNECDEANWEPKFEACLGLCPNEPCDIWTHELSIVDTPLNMFVSESDTITLQSAQLWLSSATPFVHLEMKEIWTYTWHTFISNIGGQMGLWLGVSLLSLLRLWQMCCINAYKGYRGLHAEVSIKRAHKKTIQEGITSNYWFKRDEPMRRSTNSDHPNGAVPNSNHNHTNDMGFARVLLPNFCSSRTFTDNVPECEVHMV